MKNPPASERLSFREDTDVRFGSLADVGTPTSDVRSTSIADMLGASPNVRFVPQADVNLHSQRQ
jgi:hypothetical protein